MALGAVQVLAALAAARAVPSAEGASRAAAAPLGAAAQAEAFNIKN